MTDNADTKLTDTSLDMLAELFKEQLRLLGRLLAVLRKTPLAKPARSSELALEIAAGDLGPSPRVAYERSEEVAATD